MGVPKDADACIGDQPAPRTGRIRVAPALSKPTAARGAPSRLAHWRPTYWPLLLSYVVIVAADFKVAIPHAGIMAWPLTVLWTWPIFTTLTGILGIRRTRRALREADARWAGQGLTTTRDGLVVVVPTVGRDDTYPALERSVRSFVDHLPPCFPRLRVDIVVDEGCAAAGRIARLAANSGLIRVLTVPADYRTPNRTRFKARATHYAHEVRIHEGEARDDVWVLHMDDDTGVGPDTALAMTRFIVEQTRTAGGMRAGAKHLAQGILTYPREHAANRITWLADAVRPAEDIGRFSAWTGSGTPRAGVHGELLLVRASIEAAIGWDFGPQSLVEDAQFALLFSARYKGRSGWFAGRCYGASPATLRDFFKQRERWSWGLAALVFNRSLQRRNRLLLAYSVLSWVVGPIQNVGVVLLIGLMLADPNTSPVSLLVIPLWALNMAYTIWMYWEGLRLNAGVSREGRRRWWEPIALVGLIPLFGLLESVPGLRGFLKFARGTENQFLVITKPS